MNDFGHARAQKYSLKGIAFITSMPSGTFIKRLFSSEVCTIDDNPSFARAGLVVSGE